MMNQILQPFEEEPFSPPDDVPIFPLPDMVLLPGEPMPLHIFENRYQLMAEQAMSSERLIVMGYLKPGADQELEKSDEIYDVAGLGQIVMDERLNDGRLNLVLLGLKRIKIKRIIQDKPYKRAKVEILGDRYSQTSSVVLSNLENRIIDLGQKLLKLKKDELLSGPNPAPILENLKAGAAPLSSLCDLVGAALLFSPIEKQMILEETDVIRRAEKLIFSLRFQLESALRGSPQPPSLLQ